MNNIISAINNTQFSKKEKHKQIITVLYGVTLIDLICKKQSGNGGHDQEELR